MVRRWCLLAILVAAAGYAYFKTPIADEFELEGLRLGQLYSPSNPSSPGVSQAVIVNRSNKIVSITGTELRYQGQVYSPNDWALLEQRLGNFYKVKKNQEFVLFYPLDHSLWILRPFRCNEFLIGAWPPPRGIVERCNGL